jgi:hypothetical protein
MSPALSVASWWHHGFIMMSFIRLCQPTGKRAIWDGFFVSALDAILTYISPSHKPEMTSPELANQHILI